MMLQMHLNHIKDGATFFGCWSGIDVCGHSGRGSRKGLTQYTGKDLCEVVRQGPKTLSDPMKQYRAQLAGDVIVDGHHPINEWCRMNTSVKTDVNANIQPVKLAGKAKNRIDGMMAELFAYIAYLRHKDEYEAIL